MEPYHNFMENCCKNSDDFLSADNMDLTPDTQNQPLTPTVTKQPRSSMKEYDDFDFCILDSDFPKPRDQNLKSVTRDTQKTATKTPTKNLDDFSLNILESDLSKINMFQSQNDQTQ